MTQPVLAIENLALRTTGKQPKTILEDVSFHVDAGEVVCVVGESGSGKSVTCLAVMGLLDPSGLARPMGRIVLDGTNVLDCDREELRQLRASRMSMVFQEPMTALNPVMTVGLQIDEILRHHTSLDRSQRRARVLGMLDAVQLPQPERIYASYPHQLS
jgi:peptide/nickel transport system ATP-binding protein